MTRYVGQTANPINGKHWGRNLSSVPEIYRRFYLSIRHPYVATGANRLGLSMRSRRGPLLSTDHIPSTRHRHRRSRFRRQRSVRSRKRWWRSRTVWSSTTWSSTTTTTWISTCGSRWWRTDNTWPSNVVVRLGNRRHIGVDKSAVGQPVVIVTSRSERRVQTTLDDRPGHVGSDGWRRGLRWSRRWWWKDGLVEGVSVAVGCGAVVGCDSARRRRDRFQQTRVHGHNRRVFQS